jgi:hypothetical protein
MNLDSLTKLSCFGCARIYISQELGHRLLLKIRFELVQMMGIDSYESFLIQNDPLHETGNFRINYQRIEKN